MHILHSDFQIPKNQQVYENTEVKKRVASLNPYGKWLNENMRSLEPRKFLSTSTMESETILRRQQ